MCLANMKWVLFVLVISSEFHKFVMSCKLHATLKNCIVWSFQVKSYQSKGETIDGNTCIKFDYGSEEYEAGHCKFDYFHNKPWCKYGSGNHDWGYCQAACPNNNGKLV